MELASVVFISSMDASMKKFYYECVIYLNIQTYLLTKKALVLLVKITPD